MPFPLTWSSSTNPPPPPLKNGEVRSNAGTFAGITTLYVDDQAADGRYLRATLLQLVVNDQVSLEDVADVAHYVKFAVTAAPVGQNGYTQIAVSLVTSAGAIFTNNQAVNGSLVDQGVPIDPPPDTLPPGLGVGVTAHDLIVDALRELEVLSALATLSPQDAAFGLTRLNQLLGSWMIQRLTIPGVVRDVKTLVSGQSSYQIGPGAVDWNQLRPHWIQQAGLVNLAANGVETPLEVLTADRYARIGLKSMVSTLPWAIYDDRAEPVGTITVYPSPVNSALQLALYIPIALARFPDLTTPVILGDGVETAISRNLALSLARPFGKPLQPDLVADAAARLADLKRVHMDRLELLLDPAFCPRPLGGYDVYSDTYRGWRS